MYSTSSTGCFLQYRLFQTISFEKEYLDVPDIPIKYVKISNVSRHHFKNSWRKTQRQIWSMAERALMNTSTGFAYRNQSSQTINWTWRRPNWMRKSPNNWKPKILVGRRIKWSTVLMILDTFRWVWLEFVTLLLPNVHFFPIGIVLESEWRNREHFQVPQPASTLSLLDVEGTSLHIECEEALKQIEELGTGNRMTETTAPTSRAFCYQTRIAFVSYLLNNSNRNQTTANIYSVSFIRTAIGTKSKWTT